MSLISCENLTLAYDGSVAVKDVSITVDEGDYLCIVGENGTGKSTLMKGILGLIKPVSGCVKYDGLRQNEVGYIPQQTPVQRDFPACVREIILSGCISRIGIKPFYGRADRQRAQENMKLLGIEGLANRCYRELSGGQQQRVLLARALCATERILFLDEPAAGLDPMVVNELYGLLSSLNRERGVTVVMVSHDVNCIIDYATKVLHMSHEPVFFGTAEDYIKSGVGSRFLGGDAQ